MSSDVEHLWKLAMADARRYIYTRLCGANSYIDVIANSSMCSSSYPLYALEHFVQSAAALSDLLFSVENFVTLSM